MYQQGASNVAAQGARAEKQALCAGHKRQVHLGHEAPAHELEVEVDSRLGQAVEGWDWVGG